MLLAALGFLLLASTLVSEKKRLDFHPDVDDALFERIKSETEIDRACFLGNPDRHRRERIVQLVDAGIPIDVFGEDWGAVLKETPLLRLKGLALGEEMYRALRRYRVQLNFFRPHNVGSHNMRSFEVPAAGGIMLAQDSDEHREFFEPGQEAFYFSTPEEMIEWLKRTGRI